MGSKTIAFGHRARGGASLYLFAQKDYGLIIHETSERWILIGRAAAPQLRGGGADVSYPADLEKEHLPTTYTGKDLPLRLDMVTFERLMVNQTPQRHVRRLKGLVAEDIIKPVPDVTLHSYVRDPDFSETVYRDTLLHEV